jgi:hypothetical protein
LKQELEDKLTNEVPSMGYENVDRIRIADIQFSFKNSSLINTLKIRGQNIKENNWAALKKTSELLDRIKTKEYQNLLIPVGAFITFESEEGLHRCLSLKTNTTNVRILGEKPRVKPAPEPTNIIWENRQYTTISRIYKVIMVFAIILLLLAGSFALIVRLKKEGREANNKY